MSKTALISLILIVVLILLLAGGFIWYQNQTQKSALPPVTSNPETQLPLEAVNNLKLTPEIVEQGGQTLVKLWWEPTQGAIPLSTAALRTTITNPNGTVKTQSTKPNLSEDYLIPGWKTAFSSITDNPDGTTTLEISLVYAAPEPYNVAQKALLLSFPVTLSPTTDQLNLSVDQTVSKAFNKEAQTISISE